ncbi:MAG: hypothetical protein JNM78_03445 [Cyclobacteriaceae bacterium]|nr:hypothetical protein [Cyclobacteriaceae bacterium]
MRKFIFLSFLFIPCIASSQTDFKKIMEWKTKNVMLITEDRLGNFFLVQKDGKIKKYNPNGKILASGSEKSLTLIEPWYQPSIFIYVRSKQKYTISGRNFENKQEFDIEPAFAIEPYLVCPTHDNKLWILDHADLSLKKVNRLTNEVIHEFEVDSTMLSPNNEFIYLREYLNLIFLLDKNSGILILNHLGKLINKIEVTNLKSFYFYGEDLYYLSDNKLTFFNILTEKQREIQLPVDSQQAILTDERIITLDSNGKVTLYSYSPEVP